MIPVIPERPHAAPHQVTLPELALVVIRHEGVGMADLPALFDGSFGALGGAAESGTFVPVGPAVAVYHGDPSEPFDLEIGFPVAEAPTAPIPLGDYVAVASRLEPGPAYAASHLGTYDGLGGAWAALVQVATDAGAHLTGRLIEAYVTEPFPGIDPSHLRTDLLLPVD